jgi:hypothetical protein
MPPVVPGQAFEVKTTFTNRSPIELKALRVKLEGHGSWAAQPETPARDAGSNAPVSSKFTLTTPADAALTRPYFSRKSIQDPRYTMSDESQFSRPNGEPPLVAVATFDVNGVRMAIREPVTRLDANLPAARDARARRRASDRVTMRPGQVVPLGGEKNVRLRIEVSSNRKAGMKARSG